MSAAKRQDAGAAVGGLFDRPSATGGLAGRLEAAAAQTISAGASRAPRSRASSHERPRADARLRLNVELTEKQTTFLRSLGRPARTGAPRSLGAKFIATGLLSAAIELLQSAEVDMSGVAAGDLVEMQSRARNALLSVVARNLSTEGDA
jgi:hypothetical protein